MKTLLFAFLVYALAKPSQEHHYDRPQAAFSVADSAVQFSTQILRGNNGKSYEVSMSPSRRIYEKRVLFHEQHLSPAAGRALLQTQQPYVYAPPPVHNSLQSTGFNVNSHHSLNNRQQSFNLNANQQHNGIFAANIAQNNYNQQQQVYYQQQVASRQQQPYGQTAVIVFRKQEQPVVGALRQSATQQQQSQQQFVTYSRPTQQQQQLQQQFVTYTRPTQQQQQQQQQFVSFSRPTQQQPLHNNYLVNNRKYVSQSEAAQLDVYPYKQINGNARAFTRTISQCDVSGRCVPQNTANGSSGGKYFSHQQMIEQPKAQVAPNAGNTYQFKNPNQLTGYAKPNNKARQQTKTDCRKGAELKGRRLFPYSEVIIAQDPYN